jgi:hypothetical protein
MENMHPHDAFDEVVKIFRKALPHVEKLDFAQGSHEDYVNGTQNAILKFFFDALQEGSYTDHDKEKMLIMGRMYWNDHKESMSAIISGSQLMAAMNKARIESDKGA